MSFISQGKKQELELTIYKGFSFEKSFAWEDEAGVPINYTGYSVRFVGRESLGGPIVFDTDGQSWFNMTPASGEFDFDMGPEDTLELDFDCLHYDVLVFQGDEDAPTWTRNEPLFSGTLYLKDGHGY